MLGADADLRLEQHAAAESDLVGAEEFAGRAGVDGEPEAGTEYRIRRAELRREADRGIIGVAGAY